MNLFSKGFASLAALMLASSANAAQVNYTLSGVFTGGMLTGEAFSLNLGYDSSIAPYDTVSFSPGAQSAYSFFSFGSISGTFGNINLSRAYVVNDFGSDQATFLDGVLTSVTFFDSSSSVLNSTNLPTAAQLAAFSQISISVGTQSGFSSYSGNPSAAPEPAMWASMLAGFGAVGFAMRRRSKVRHAVSFA